MYIEDIPRESDVLSGLFDNTHNLNKIKYAYATLLMTDTEK